MTDLLLERRAHLSGDGLYRYTLTRRWGDGALLPFIMLNPSTADHEIDDPTIRRCIGFARRERADGILVGNIFAYRATNPDDLRGVNDPNGPGNDQNLRQIVEAATAAGMPVVCAWGTGGALHNGHRSVIDLMQRAGARLVCLGKTLAGFPRHPLYVRSDQPLEPFP